VQAPVDACFDRFARGFDIFDDPGAGFVDRTQHLVRRYELASVGRRAPNIGPTEGHPVLSIRTLPGRSSVRAAVRRAVGQPR
jgi:hypothetical protein